ncbi:MAG: DNA polymerase/3'-5' exonuclease PolX [Bacteroidetes bacterium]|nr:DNA polymerase/3'-5' exonuclease PolX [Bacteroidota bacterium]
MSHSGNKQLSRYLSDLSAVYTYLGGTERFRAAAYRKAAKVVEALPDDIAIYCKKGTLRRLPGIGESIAQKIEEFNKSGKIGKLEALKKQVPYELLDLLSVSGFGPESLRRLHEELGISTHVHLEQAIKQGKISQLPGFGKQKIENMLRGLKLFKDTANRMLLPDAMALADQVIASLTKIPGVLQAAVAGSIRRRKETIGDIDVIVSCHSKDRAKIAAQFVKEPFVERVIVKGITKVSVIHRPSNRQIDLRIMRENEWGSGLHYFTGSREHNIHLRSLASSRGYRISEYGIFNRRSGKWLGGKTEDDIYRILGMSLMPPEMREDHGEIELSIKHEIPELVDMKDLRGDMHMHSTWSDGMNTPEQMTSYIQKHFRYDYTVLSDHSPASVITHGMNAKQVLKQIEKVRAINRNAGNQFLKTGIEVDILMNGELDMPDEILAQLDWVTASIHRGFTKDNTERLLKACENRYVCCIGHPTGRLIGSRAAYPLNMDELIRKAALTGTALEINAQPRRLDLKDEHIRSAVQAGVKLVITTDAHTYADLHNMEFGIYMARRGWCTKNDILNTQSWKEIEHFRDKKRNGNK